MSLPLLCWWVSQHGAAIIRNGKTRRRVPVPGDIVVLQFPVRLIRGRNLDFPLPTIPTVSRYEKYDDYQNAFTFGQFGGGFY